MIQVKVTYISNIPPLVVEHAFPLTEFVGLSVHATFGCSGGIMSTARSELPFPCISQAKSQVKTSLREKLCDDVQSRT